MSPKLENPADLPAEVERSEQARRDLLREAVYIVRLFAPREMAVVPSLDGGWKCSMSQGHQGMQAFNDYVLGKRDDIDAMPDGFFQPDQIEYNEQSLKVYPRQVVHGLLRHEIGHAKRSSYKNIARGARVALDQNALPTSLLSGMNACEDCWMEECERQDSVAGRQQLDLNIVYHLPPNFGVLKTGQMPRLRQLGIRILLHNAQNRGIVTQSQVEEWETYFSQDVKEAFARVRPHAERYFDTAQTADENYRLYVEKIWPEFKEFEDRSVEDELLNRIINPQTEEDQKLRKEFDRQLRRELERELKRQEADRKIKRKEFEKSDESDENPLQTIEKWVRKNIFRQSGPEEAGQETRETDEITNKTRSRIKRALQRGKGKLDSGNLPEDLREAAKRELQRVEGESPEASASSRRLAKQTVDRAQAEELREALPAGMDLKEGEDGVLKPQMDPCDPQEVQSQKDALREFSKEDDGRQSQEREGLMERIGEAETTEELEEIRAEELPPNHEDEIKDAIERKIEQIEREEEQRRINMERLGFNPDERELYDEYIEIEREIRRDLKWYRDNLVKILPKKTETVYGGAYYSGPKIKDRRGMIARVLTGRGNIYQRPDVKEVPKPKIFLVLLIDRSSSMAGKKMHESLKTAVLFNELSKEFDVPVSIIFYDDSVEEVKTLREDFDAPDAKIKAKFMRASKKSGATNIGLAIDHSIAELQALKRHYTDMGGILLAMTDGIPTAGEEPGATKAKIDQTNKSFPTVALYLAGQKMNAAESAPVEALFGSRESGRTVVVDNFDNLRQNAFFAFKKAAEFLMRRYQ